jgi:putative transposase
MRRGFLYLVAVMDWATRKVLAWRLSNTMEAHFCVAALKGAMDAHGRPEIFNTDQGSQFTSDAFTGALADVGIRISMDGRGRWMDNVFIERLWRSIKYECVFLNAFETGGELEPASVAGSTSTTSGVRTRRWATGRPTRPMLSKSSRRIWRAETSRTPP